MGWCGSTVLASMRELRDQVTQFLARATPRIRLIRLILSRLLALILPLGSGLFDGRAIIFSLGGCFFNCTAYTVNYVLIAVVGSAHFRELTC